MQLESRILKLESRIVFGKIAREEKVPETNVYIFSIVRIHGS